MKILSTKSYIAAELVVLMLLIPAAIMHFHLIRYMLPTLWVIAIYCLWVHRHTTGETLRHIWGGAAVTRAVLKPILVRLALCAVFLTVATMLLLPERLLSLLLERPALWVLIMCLYPILSVIPQEIIFRLHFFTRYKHIFKTNELMIIASGLAFGMAHIIFENWVAPLLCAIGGMMFALTYHRKRSLALVSLEHALYGDFIFTIGLGYYFYHGSVQAIAAAAN